MNIVYLSLGSNMWDREALLTRAVDSIGLQIWTIESVSSIYETQARGTQDQQQAYLNICLKLLTNNDPHQILDKALTIELNMWRTRTASNTYEPRPIDIDILFYNDIILSDKNLIIPHPRLHLRRFVLQPLYEIAPNLIHPVLKHNISQLINDCADTCEISIKS